MIQPLHAGNALRLFLEPLAGAISWRILRKGSETIAAHDDATALLVYEGDERVVLDAEHLLNDVMQFYRVFYTLDGSTWTPSAHAHGTATANYVEHTTDVMSKMRERLEAGLRVECERGNFATELGYIQVYTAPPTMEQGLRFPLVTLHLEDESAAERGLGDDMGIDVFDSVGFDWDESEGWLANVRLMIIGWALNSDERLELRKAIRRLVVANLSVFASYGWVTPALSQQDLDAVSGEYSSPMYQVMSTFTCIAPVIVGGAVDAIREIEVNP